MSWYDITGNIADWVMAGSAVGAYLIAKDYYSDIIKKDGYDHIKKLHLELIPALERNLNLSTINLLDSDVPNYIAGEKGVFQNEDDVESTLFTTLTNDLNSLKKSLSESHRLVREIRKTYKELEVYGWSMFDSKRDILKDILKTNEEVFISIHNIVIYLKEILSRTSPEFLPLDNKEDYSVRSLPPAFQSIEELSARLVKAQNHLYRAGDEETPYTKATDLISSYYSGGKNLRLFFQFKKTNVSFLTKLKTKLKNKFR